jgi:acid phosphatase
MATSFQRFLVLLGSACVFACSVSTHEPQNLTHLKREVGDYVDNGTYFRDLETSSEPARSWIKKRAAEGGKLAVVFDIDETVLSNLPHIRKEDWGYDPQIWGQWVARRSAPAIPPLRDVYQTALDHDVEVFFITGRRSSEKAATAANLRSQGMGRYSALILKPDDFPSKQSAVLFKAAERAKIEARGYQIIASIGDQQSDLDGGHAEKTFKLPNPFYFIP